MTTTGARIAGLGAYRPPLVLDNAEFAPLGVSDSRLRERTGIARRRRAAAGQEVLDLAEAAGSDALATAAVDPADVDLVLLATSSNPWQTPGLAPALASRVGARGAGASDVVAGCAGFGYALAFAGHAVAAGGSRAALVVGAEKLSAGVDWTDGATCPLFGDGAGAAVVTGSDAPGIGPVVWGSDGDRRGVIGMSRSWQDYVDDPASPRPYLRMDGREVFLWAARSMLPVARRACAAAGVEIADLAGFVPHQANLRLVEVLARGLGLPPTAAVADDVVDSANTSAASVPLALHRLTGDGAVPSGAPVLLLSFGAGLTFAAQVVTCP